MIKNKFREYLLSLTSDWNKQKCMFEGPFILVNSDRTETLKEAFVFMHLILVLFSVVMVHPITKKD